MRLSNWIWFLLRLQTATHSLLGIAMLQTRAQCPGRETPRGIFRRGEASMRRSSKQHGNSLFRVSFTLPPWNRICARTSSKRHAIGQVKSIRYTKYSSRQKPANANVIENLASHAFRSYFPRFLYPNHLLFFRLRSRLKTTGLRPLSSRTPGRNSTWRMQAKRASATHRCGSARWMGASR